MSKRILGILAVVGILTAWGGAPALASGPGSHSATEVNNSIERAIEYLDLHQNGNGSFGSAVPIAETAFALISYGVLDRGDVNNLSASRQVIVESAVAWLLGQQDTTTGNQTSGAWMGDNVGAGPLATYDTGLAVSALVLSTNGDPGNPSAIPNAIGAGRNALVGLFQGPTHNPSETCSTAHSDATSVWCGGFNYDWGLARSDESNTTFGLTGLKLSGGVPAGLASLNAGWQHNIQEISTNLYATRNDGGGKYTPNWTLFFPSFISNGNNTGSMLSGFGYDGVSGSDPGVVAGLKFGQDVLDVYELTTATRQGIYHTGPNEDGACVAGAGGCDWHFSSDGGYHYSLWSLSKGLGEYIAPDLVAAPNWYAKIVDLLLTQQEAAGTWPVDGRDDGSPFVATGFSVLALGLVATPPAGVGNLKAAGDCGAAHLTWINPSTPNYGGVVIRRRTDIFPTSPTDGTAVANAPAPATSFDDNSVSNVAKYFYGAFSYDTTGQLFGPEATATMTASCPGLPATGAGSLSAPPGLPLPALVIALATLTLLAGSRLKRKRS